jgi:hypothetical protein
MQPKCNLSTDEMQVVHIWRRSGTVRTVSDSPLAASHRVTPGMSGEAAAKSLPSGDQAKADSLHANTYVQICLDLLGKPVGHRP